MANFDPTQNPRPLTDHQKIGTGDFFGSHCGCAKFGANCKSVHKGRRAQVAEN